MITLLKGDSYTARGLEVSIALPAEGMSRLDGIELHLPMGIHKSWYLPKDGETLKATFSATEVNLLPEGTFNARLLAVKDAAPYLISRLPIKVTSDLAEAGLSAEVAGSIVGGDNINLDLSGINEEPRTDRELATAFAELLRRLKTMAGAVLILATMSANAESLVNVQTATSGDVDLDSKVVTAVTLSDKVATKDDINEATTAIFDAYGSTDSHMEVNGSELAIKSVAGPATTNTIWSIDASITNATQEISILDTRMTAVENRADLTSWGDYAPDGTPNPDPLAMLYLNKPITMFGSGLSWATSGSYAVLCQSGAVAFAGSGGGEVRFGLDVHTNYLAWVSASSIVVGARAESFAVIDGVATIEYAYSGSGDYPTIWYCTDLISQEWQEAANGSWEYVPGTGFAKFRYSVEGLNRCFFKATSNRDMGAYIRAPIAIKPEGGILVNQETVVYDTVITVTVDGKQYRIPAQEVK
jgi:hypothetical protein